MAKRNWQIDLVRDPDTGAVLNREEVRQAFLDIEGACHQIGGKIHAAPIRYEIEEGEYITTGWLFEWDSTMPAVRQAPPDPPEPESILPTDDEAITPLEAEEPAEGGDEFARRLEQAEAAAT